ncbi:ABC-2 transporter permease [Propioniciclava sp.]|uniref:ABC-2 transporter permease n=1 Tax=Propioniciclava sp. TaxID=2038686 RepID=UPI00262D3910|nr:ABC-2 transporter permease [Propioniciclava sp.]
MSELAAMIRLDLRTVGASRRLIAVYLAMATLFAASGGASFALPLIALLGVVMGLNLIGTAESNRLTLLYGSLPLRRRTVVVAHYLVTAGTTVLAVALGLAVMAVVARVRGETADDLLLSGAGVIAALFVVLAAMLPVYLRWGTKAGAIVMLLFAMVAMGAGTLWGGNAGLALQVTPALGTVGVLLVVGVAALAVSLPVALAIYERQDH